MHIRHGLTHAATPAILVIVAAPTAMIALTLATSLVLQERLPHPVASHFSGDSPDGSSPFWPTVRDIIVLDVAASSILALLAFLRPPGSIGNRLAAGCVMALTTAITGSVLLGIVLANLDAPHWSAARPAPMSEPFTIVASVVAFAMGAIAVHPLYRSAAQIAELPPEPILSRLRERRGRTVWIGQSRNRPFMRKTLAATAVMLVLALIGTYWMVIPALVCLATLHVWGGVLASFDGKTLSVRGRIPLGVIVRIPLGRIETAEAILVDPRRWGGWGWRMHSIKRHAIVVRKGEALLVALRGGGELIVTVDDAATAATEIRRALRGDRRVPLHPRPLPPTHGVHAYSDRAQGTGRPPAV
ncbi:hypothetical protein [Nonomuraea sp. NPDC002799]